MCQTGVQTVQYYATNAVETVSRPVSTLNLDHYYYHAGGQPLEIHRPKVAIFLATLDGTLTQ